MEFLELLKQVLELGWPGIVLIANVYLIQAWRRSVEEHVRDLRYIAHIRHDLIQKGWNGGTEQVKQSPLPVSE
ncbi:MAG: hypothetical protein HC893_03205 [Chloroflexaceae bacterium]|nr:hypothetical protein [Chloroflexaceae bacterium]